jgi:hypothetical protein
MNLRALEVLTDAYYICETHWLARRGAARSLLPRRWRPRSPFNWRAAEANFFQHSASLLICRCWQAQQAESERAPG